MRAEGHPPTRRGLLWLGLALGTVLLSGGLVQCQQPAAQPEAPTPSSGACSLDSLGIVPRSEWGAVEPNLNSVEGPYDPEINPGGLMVYTRPLTEVLTTIIVHHSALPLSDGPREIQQMHMELKGYADVAYHFLIDETGRIYEGRDLQTRGAHTGGHNTGTLGIVLLGDFQVARPTATQIASLKTLIACLVDRYAITHIAGHRDFQPGVTDCPGDNLEELLPGLAVEMGIVFGTDGYAGP